MLKYLILGAVLSILGIPLLSSITELIITYIELLKARISVKIVKCNAKLESNEDIRVIGFATSEEDREDDDE
jgi:hypothetical protein